MDLEAEVKRLKDELKRERADNAALTKHLDHGLRTRDARDAIASAGGNVDLLLPLVMRNTRSRKDGDNYVMEVVGEDGYTRIKDATNNMTMADFVAELRQEFPRAFTTPEGRQNAALGGTGGGIDNTPGAGVIERVRATLAAKERPSNASNASPDGGGFLGASFGEKVALMKRKVAATKSDRSEA